MSAIMCGLGFDTKIQPATVNHGETLPCYICGKESGVPAWWVKQGEKAVHWTCYKAALRRLDKRLENER